MQNFGRGMWRRIGDYSKQENHQHYIDYLTELKRIDIVNKHRAATVQQQQLLKKEHETKDSANNESTTHV